ncbi:hypothetical protein [Pseudonocardia alaniniphila]|uniref:Uncharacterized protein n=1 Tax=Pseudonocardia alaniniphila TaxID=75291 RepID=A0ABS9TQY4_9PSEU|nr:hypothetical protein [Pseudonocardia alaniniphila]MCH6170954.1 hypothetical protein [Pseudonocardia alaniniphila]
MDASKEVAGISLCEPMPRWSAVTTAAATACAASAGRPRDPEHRAGGVNRPGSCLAVVFDIRVEPIHPAKSISPDVPALGDIVVTDLF